MTILAVVCALLSGFLLGLIYANWRQIPIVCVKIREDLLSPREIDLIAEAIEKHVSEL